MCYVAFSIPGGLRASLGPGGNGVRAGPKRHPGWDAMRSEAPARLAWAGSASELGLAWLGWAFKVYLPSSACWAWLAGFGLAWAGFGLLILPGFGLDFLIFACLS